MYISEICEENGYIASIMQLLRIVSDYIVAKIDSDFEIGDKKRKSKLHLQSTSTCDKGLSFTQQRE